MEKDCSSCLCSMCGNKACIFHECEDNPGSEEFIEECYKWTCEDFDII